MIKACIFDFDGVIMDSEKYHHLAWLQLANELGTDFTYQEYCPLKSAGRKVIFGYICNKTGRKLTDDEFAYYNKHRTEVYEEISKQLNSNDIMHGVVDFITLCKNNGLKVAVASSSVANTEVARRFDLYNLFDAFVDGNTPFAPKPSPEIYLITASKLGIEPSECVVFEDSINGVKGAKSAGMKCIGIQTYFTNLADKIIDDYIGKDLSLLSFD